MKIAQADYVAMRDTIKAYFATVDVMAIASEYCKRDLSPMRFRWDVLHASGFPIARLYNVGLNDNHIDTALNKAIKELVRQ